uniref:Uncharacterized protein n=1 Tax=Trypanosoma congolense (strain IL3000) TaxID=1068625 RepID=F9WFB4_TRYCI|nr:hypothetical protein, unlikely [Trypanosoma congolense IL3000]
MRVSTTFLFCRFTFSNFPFQIRQLPCPERCHSVPLLYRHPCRDANCRRSGLIYFIFIPQGHSRITQLPDACVAKYFAVRVTLRSVGRCLQECTSSTSIPTIVLEVIRLFSFVTFISGRQLNTSRSV